jgi:hypothetical protein
MSSFAKRGERQAKVAKDKMVKKHTKGFYKILGKMDILANQLDPLIEYNEENINEYVEPVYGRNLDSMEKFVVLGKMHRIKEDINNIKVKNETEDNT